MRHFSDTIQLNTKMKNQSKKTKTINRVNQCKCGGHYIKQNKKRHFQTKKHEAYLLKQGKPRFLNIIGQEIDLD